MSDLDNVRVAVRIRPMVESEITRGSQVVVEKVADAPQVLVNNCDGFTYNFVFDGRDTQEEIYEKTVSEMIDRLFGGFNATILAYGQTGSGKTYTMGTAFDGCLNEDIGVIPRAMQDIFDRIEKTSDKAEYLVKCSFIEVYQEQLYDLLSTKAKDESIVELREDRSGIVFFGLTDETVYSSKEVTECLIRGSKDRAVGATAMNQHSSRSHAIFTITLQATSNDESQSVTTSKFHLVDLAGSERSKKTQATGDRFKEGVKINQGLLALGNVISALGEGKSGVFVRYRDSKLTRLLQDSLGGNSVTLMIACISPADYNVAETLSTLRYADRARKIKNKPIINQDPHAAEINKLKGIIQKLRMDLLVQGGSMSMSLISDLQQISPNRKSMTMSMPAYLPSDIQCRQSKELKELQEKYSHLQQQWQMTLNDVAEHEIRAHITETAQEHLKNSIVEMKKAFDEMAVFRHSETTIDINEFNAIFDRVQALINRIESEMNQNETEIIENKKRQSLSSSFDENTMNSNCLPEIQSILQDHTEAYTTMQMENNEQLRRINCELNIKEQLHQRMENNFQKFSQLEGNIEEKYKECEMKILQLEAERDELQEKLRNAKENTSIKLAEERRKRLQALEIEIVEIKRVNLYQSKLLKVREKEAQKIQNLNAEIQFMKESKVKLVRKIRQEGEKYRQFKMMHDKELLQLRNKDRKMQSEMARREILFSKQNNVLKRKCDEALAANKRLKEVLERQRVSQSQRQKMLHSKDGNTSTSKIDQLIPFLEREYEIMTSLVDAEIHLEHLHEVRRIINVRIEELNRTQETWDVSDKREVEHLQEELEMRNAQIADMQQKVYATDLDNYICSVGNNIQSMMEARAAMKHLWKTTLNMRREKTHSIEDLKTQLSSAEEKCNELSKNIEDLKVANQSIVQEYEEKIALILCPQQDQKDLQHQEDQQKTIERLMKEIENYARLLQNKKAQASKVVKNRLEPKATGEGDSKCPKIVLVGDRDSSYDEDLTDSNEDNCEEDDNMNDPDWQRTPLIRRRRVRKKCSVLSQSSSNIDTSANDVTDISNSKNACDLSKCQRRSKGCKCRDCRNLRCGCNAKHCECTERCNCYPACKNRRDSTVPIKEEGKDATNSDLNFSDEMDSNESKHYTFIKCEEEDAGNNNTARLLSTLLTPDLIRRSTIKFDTNSAKKKFF